MPAKRHTERTLPHADEQPAEPLPDFQAVMAEHGPKGDDGEPTMELPDFITPQYVPWLPEVEERVDRKAAERAPQIVEEAAAAVAEATHPPVKLDADVDLPGDYTLSWERPPTPEPIKVTSERVDRPSPRTRRVQQ